MGTGRSWTDSEERRLRVTYGYKPTPEIARELGRTKASIQRRAQYMGLRMPPRRLHPTPNDPVWRMFLVAYRAAKRARRQGLLDLGEDDEERIRKYGFLAVFMEYYHVSMAQERRLINA